MRRSAVLCLLALALIPTAVLVHDAVGGSSGRPAVEPALLRALDDLFPDDRCIPPSASLKLVAQELETLGYRDWTVRQLPAAERSPCNSASADAENRWVVLTPASRPEVANTLAAFRVRSLRDCWSRNEAEKLLRRELAAFGLTDYETRDDGPVTFPVDLRRSLDLSREEAQRHYDQGCYTYSGVTWAEDGMPIFILAGNGG